MYGMIHQAARAMALEVLGEESWRAIQERCGLDDEYFISGRHYSDEVTLALIGAATEVSGMKLDALLEALGRYWIDYAAKSPYGAMFEMAGDTLDEFLESLDSMHASIKSTMPEASMPTFEVVAVEDSRIDVLYASERTGLSSFVVGLLEGLMDRFDEVGEVTARADANGVLFSITRQQRAA